LRLADFARLFFLSAMWGGSFLLIRISAPELGALLLAEGRAFFAALSLGVYALATSGLPGFRERWKHYLVVGALNGAVPFMLGGAAAVYISASMAAILNATIPLFSATFAAAGGAEPLTIRRVVGLLLGIVGVVVLVGWNPLPLTPTLVLASAVMLLSASVSAMTGLYARSRAGGGGPMDLAIGSSIGSSVLLLPLAPLAIPAVAPDWGAVACAVALGVFSTGLGNILYFRLILDLGATRGLLTHFLIPAFAVLWARLFLGEPLAPGVILGTALILTSLALVTGVRLSLSRRDAVQAS
jgi:drug/metabolite transporter (DMT)-like permease